MEKVKVSREQAEAIEWAMNNSPMYEDNPNLLLQNHGYSRYTGQGFELHLKPLNDMDTLTLSKALSIGYEVEPEFKVGDKIIDTEVGSCPVIEIQKIEEKHLIGTWTTDYGHKVNTAVKSHRARHATPEEIAAEKERRTKQKIEELLSDLSQEEIKHLRDKLAWEYNCYGELVGDEDE